MMEWFYGLDITFFVLLNQTLTNGVFDVLMPWLTDINQLLAFRIVVLGLVVFAVWKGGEPGRRLVLVLIFALVVSDQVNSFLFKEWVGRLRPCHELFDVRLLVDCGGGKSFPSSHAVNAGTIAIVVSYFYPRALWSMVTFAVLLGYSRIYVGVHYPSDVIAGLLLGGAWGWSASAFVLSAERRVRAWITPDTKGHPRA